MGFHSIRNGVGLMLAAADFPALGLATHRRIGMAHIGDAAQDGITFSRQPIQLLLDTRRLLAEPAALLFTCFALGGIFRFADRLADLVGLAI